MALVDPVALMAATAALAAPAALVVRAGAALVAATAAPAVRAGAALAAVNAALVARAEAGLAAATAAPLARAEAGLAVVNAGRAVAPDDPAAVEALAHPLQVVAPPSSAAALLTATIAPGAIPMRTALLRAMPYCVIIAHCWATPVRWAGEPPCWSVPAPLSNFPS